MPEAKPIQGFIFTEHALAEMARRKISEEEVRNALAIPDQMEMVRAGRVVYQTKLYMSEFAKTYILRVFLDIDRNPPQVVTVYRTSKVEKYWR